MERELGEVEVDSRMDDMPRVPWARGLDRYHVNEQSIANVAMLLHVLVELATGHVFLDFSICIVAGHHHPRFLPVSGVAVIVVVPPWLREETKRPWSVESHMGGVVDGIVMTSGRNTNLEYASIFRNTIKLLHESESVVNVLKEIGRNNFGYTVVIDRKTPTASGEVVEVKNQFGRLAAVDVEISRVVPGTASYVQSHFYLR